MPHLPLPRLSRSVAMLFAGLVLTGAAASGAHAEDTGADGKSGRVIPKEAQTSAPDLAPAETTPAPTAGATPAPLSQPESSDIEETVPSNDPKPVEPQTSQPQSGDAGQASAPATPESGSAPDAAPGQPSATPILPNDDTPDTEMPAQPAPSGAETTPAK